MRARPVTGPVEIVDRALQHVRDYPAAAFFLGVAPNAVLAEGGWWAFVHARTLALRPGARLAAAAGLSAGFLLKGVFVSAALRHADAAALGWERSPGECLREAVRAGARAIAARAAWTAIWLAALATGILFPLLPVALLAAQRPVRETRRLVGSTLFRPARPVGEGWSRIPLMQLALLCVLLFVFGNLVLVQAVAGYVFSGARGPWPNVIAATSPAALPGFLALAFAALALFGPVAVAAGHFLEEDLEGKTSGRDLRERLEAAGA